MTKLTSDKTDFESETITTEKKGHYMTKGPIHQEDITVLYIYSQYQST